MTLQTMRQRREAEGLLLGVEVAKMLGISYEAFRPLLATGALPETVTHPMSRQTFWRRQDIEEWVDSHGGVPTPAEARREVEGLMSAGEVASEIGLTVKGFRSARARGAFDVEPVHVAWTDRQVWRRCDVEAWVEERRI